MATPRGEVVADGQAVVYHCISRCVRRAFLCGFDKYLNRSFEHRKAWIKDRLQFLESDFAVDLCSYAILSSHLHAVIRTDPDRVARWSDEGVARRWPTIFHKASGRCDNAALLPAELQALVTDKVRLKDIRARLSSVSWFMRCPRNGLTKISPSTTARFPAPPPHHERFRINRFHFGFGTRWLPPTCRLDRPANPGRQTRLIFPEYRSQKIEFFR
jgi:hypothetical protein